MKTHINGASQDHDYIGQSVSSAEIENDSIVDADIKSNAAIALSKLATTGALSATTLALTAYERHVQIPAKLDGTVANQPLAIDFFTLGGLQFATTGTKNAFCQFEVPDDWNGTDMYFEIDWLPDSGAISGTDVVDFTVSYRSIAEGEAINLGTAVTIQTADAGDYAQYVTKHARVTLAFNNADQPLSKQDHVYISITRNTANANDWTGSVTVAGYELIYNSTSIPTT